MANHTCGTSSDDGGSSGGGGDMGLLPFGADCTVGTQCASGLCNQFQMGAVHKCTKTCTVATQATDCPNPPSTGLCNGMGFCKF
jgi:hypothetical protein